MLFSDSVTFKKFSTPSMLLLLPSELLSLLSLVLLSKSVVGLVTMMLSVGMFTSVTGFSPLMPGLLPASSFSFQDNDVVESPGDNEDADDVSGEVVDPTEGIIAPVVEVVGIHVAEVEEKEDC